MSEKSAGGIIYYNDSRSFFVLLMKDRKGKWTFPKGKLEEGEDDRTAAAREIEEEVGIRKLVYKAALLPVIYYYFRIIPIRKTVQYFVFEAKTKTTPVVQEEEGIMEAKWVRYDTAKKIIGYPKTNMPLLTQIYDYTHPRG